MFLVGWSPDSTNMCTFAFDLLAEGHRDWRSKPYRDRRGRLEELFAHVAPPLQLTPMTNDQDDALQQWMSPSSARTGIEGIMVKASDQPYRAGRSRAWRKIRSVGVRATCRAVLAGE